MDVKVCPWAGAKFLNPVYSYEQYPGTPCDNIFFLVENRAYRCLIKKDREKRGEKETLFRNDFEPFFFVKIVNNARGCLYFWCFCFVYCWRLRLYSLQEPWSRFKIHCISQFAYHTQGARSSGYQTKTHVLLSTIFLLFLYYFIFLILNPSSFLLFALPPYACMKILMNQCPQVLFYYDHCLGNLICYSRIYALWRCQVFGFE